MSFVLAKKLGELVLMKMSANRFFNTMNHF